MNFVNEAKMRRDITEELKKWKDSSRRKPLILTGVRQCGKTYVLKEFGKEFFDNVCYINFESSEKYRGVFEFDFDVNRIISEIELAENIKIIAGRTLVFFDEIQECPKAITSLKYFCENMPELHLVTAGSLLGVALKKENISFPVGKVNRMQMYPMNFGEFLSALGNDELLKVFENWNVDREIPDLYSVPFERLLKEYYAVGGMPEAVAEYSQSKDYEAVKQIQSDILADYADDFSKHAPAVDIEKIRMIWDSIPKQLAKENKKFMFSHVKEGKRAFELEAALEWLKNAGLIQKLEMVSNAEAPLAANADATYFKIYMSDVGLLSRKLGLDTDSFNDDSFLQTFKGAITENYVLNELMSLKKNPYFWRSGNTAELDFVYESESRIIPIEVKSATNTRAKSYRQFCMKYKPETGFKLSMKNIAENDCEGTRTISLPLYLLWDIDRYVKIRK